MLQAQEDHPCSHYNNNQRKFDIWKPMQWNGWAFWNMPPITLLFWGRFLYFLVYFMSSVYNIIIQRKFLSKHDQIQNSITKAVFQLENEKGRAPGRALWAHSWSRRDVTAYMTITIKPEKLRIWRLDIWGTVSVFIVDLNADIRGGFTNFTADYQTLRLDIGIGI